ncbi:hypothetical protein [Methylobacterium oryzisoli]|uniref:hypothetical protein n=1 Tax=Methylobacterium oryzisoli TaxID=3385502 RepID=UPI0038915033
MSEGFFEQPERDDDRILAAIRWPKDVETYNHIMSIVTVLGSGVLVIDAPEQVFAEVAQAIRDADGIAPERRRRYLFQISSRPREFKRRPYVEALNNQLGPRGIMRLSELIYDGGLTPTEARPWLEPPECDWPEVERLLFEIFERRPPGDKPLPFHLAQWVGRYRDTRAGTDR